MPLNGNKTIQFPVFEKPKCHSDSANIFERLKRAHGQQKIYFRKRGVGWNIKLAFIHQLQKKASDNYLNENNALKPNYYEVT